MSDFNMDAYASRRATFSEANQQDRLFEYFVIVGIGTIPRVIKYERKDVPVFAGNILHRYPSEDYRAWPLHEQLAQFCNPEGFSPVDFPADEEPPVTILPFVLTGLQDTSRLYASVLRVYVLFDGDSVEATGLSQTYLGHQRGGSSTSGGSEVSRTPASPPTNTPAANAKDTFRLKRYGTMRRLTLSYKRNTERVPLCFCILSRFPVFNFHEKFLQFFYKNNLKEWIKQGICSDGDKGLEVLYAKDIFPIISSFQKRGIFPNTFQKVIKFEKNKESQIEFVASPISDLPFIDFSLKPLFEISTTSLLLLLRCLLMEKSVLLYSTSYSKITYLAQSLCTLMFPFKYQHVYSPVLPPAFEEFIFAPTAYTLGIHSSVIRDPQERVSQLPDVVFVDIDHDSILFSKSFWVIDFPKKQEEELASAMVEIRVQEQDLSLDDANFSMRVRRAFLDFFANILRLYREYYKVHQVDLSQPQNLEDIFDIKRFIDDSPEDYKEFLIEFSETSTFFSFLMSRFSSNYPFNVFDDYIDVVLLKQTLKAPYFFQYFPSTSATDQLSQSPELGRSLTSIGDGSFRASTFGQLDSLSLGQSFGTPGSSPTQTTGKILRTSNPPVMNRDAKRLKEMLKSIVQPLTTGTLPAPLQLTLSRLEVLCDAEELIETLEFMRMVAASTMKGAPLDAAKRDRILRSIETRYGRAILTIAIAEQMNMHQRTPLSDAAFDSFAELYNTMLSRISAQKDFKCAMVIMELSFMQYRFSGKMEHTFIFHRLKHQGIWSEKQFWINTLDLQVGGDGKADPKKKGPRARIEFERLGRLADCMIKFDHSARRINSFIDDVCVIYSISKEDAKELKALAEQLWKINRIR